MHVPLDRIPTEWSLSHHRRFERGPCIRSDLQTEDSTAFLRLRRSIGSIGIFEESPFQIEIACNGSACASLQTPLLLADATNARFGRMHAIGRHQTHHKRTRLFSTSHHRVGAIHPSCLFNVEITSTFTRAFGQHIYVAESRHGGGGNLNCRVKSRSHALNRRWLYDGKPLHHLEQNSMTFTLFFERSLDAV